MAKKPKTDKSVETLTHDADKRKNIPTAEYQSVVKHEQQRPVRVEYQRRNRDLDPQLVWRGKDEQDWSDLVVHAPPLYIQEKVHPKALVDDLLRQSQQAKDAADRASGKLQQLDLFADFNGVPEGDARTEFYQHDANWSNRMILGDSLQVMASLAEREGLRGQVQCIYFDPPYGIKFNSNFQWSTTSRDVKDGKTDHITREPEQVKAFRDTWRDGIHSYLTYLRDRLTVARDLLTDSGSIFVQIGDENVHRVRALMDEVFGEDNFVSLVSFRTTTGLGDEFLDSSCNFLLWYCRDKSKLKYRELFKSKGLAEDVGGRYRRVQLAHFDRRPMIAGERSEPAILPVGALIYRNDNLTSQSGGEKSAFNVDYRGQTFRPGRGFWKTNETGMQRLLQAERVASPTPNSIQYVRFLDDFPVSKFSNVWTDTQTGAFTEEKVYVVQTNAKVVERCLLMATDPGDLVLDPTCGSGTTAYVAEQWGRRWITIDTSRVALALARARIMGARYAYYLLADSRDGQLKEAEVTGAAPSTQPVHGNIRHGFVYERVPHITLKSIANNAEIDVIWEKWQQVLEPLREQLNAAVGRGVADTAARSVSQADAEGPSLTRRATKEARRVSEGGPGRSASEAQVTRRVSEGLPAPAKSWEEWQIPREADASWPQAAKKLHAEWWQARIARQKEIDGSIAAKAEFEYLYDKPYEDKKKVRVAGPFTVESLSPHRMLGVDENDELIDPLRSGKGEGGRVKEERDFAQMVLENLKTAGVQQAHKEDRITFTSLTPWPGRYVCAEGRYEKGEGRSEKSETGPSPFPLHSSPFLRAAIFIGPEFGTVQRQDLVLAAREAGDAGFDVLVACAFNYDAHSTEFSSLGRIPVLKARMNADLHMAEDLKNTGKGNLFVIFGEPDIEVVGGLWLVASNGRMVASYERVKELSGAGGLEEINRLGGADLRGFKDLSRRGAVRIDKPGAVGSSLNPVEHRGGRGEKRNGGIPSELERGERIARGAGNTTDPGESAEHAEGRRDEGLAPTGGRSQQNAWRSETVAAIEALTSTDFPLLLTTSHYTQVTVRGVDVFHPTTGEIRSDGPEGIACWFIDTDYNDESFFVRHAYFLGQNDPYSALRTTLKAEINAEAWESLHSAVSRPFPKPRSGRIAVKVINHLGDEVMKVFRVD